MVILVTSRNSQPLCLWAEMGPHPCLIHFVPASQQRGQLSGQCLLPSQDPGKQDRRLLILLWLNQVETEPFSQSKETSPTTASQVAMGDRKLITFLALSFPRAVSSP